MKKQAVIKLAIGRMAWGYYVLLWPVMLAAFVQRAKAWVLRRAVSEVFINCEVAGFVPDGPFMAVDQAAKVTGDAVVKALAGFQKVNDKHLLDLVAKNTELENWSRQLAGENVKTKQYNSNLLRDVREHQKTVEIYRNRQDADRGDLVQEIAEQKLVLDRASATNKKLHEQIRKLKAAKPDFKNKN